MLGDLALRGVLVNIEDSATAGNSRWQQANRRFCSWPAGTWEPGVSRRTWHCASWVVSGKTGLPSGYSPDQLHPELKGSTLIRSEDELRTLLTESERSEDS